MAKDISRRERKRLERKKKKEEERINKGKERHKKRIKKYSFAALVFVILTFGIYFVATNSQFVKVDPNEVRFIDPENILDVNLRDHSQIALHIHPVLEIEVLGKNVPIPANTGISPSGMNIIHTHDSSGTLHVEPPIPTDLNLGGFFTIWGKTFNSTCIFENCVDESHELKFFVNDDESDDFENLILRDGQRIKIVYQKKN